jgi:lysophospholipase L1-like esterase
VNRRRFVGILAVLSVLAFLGHKHLSGNAYINLPPTSGTGWVAFGDSLTAGVGADPGKDYPSQLSDILGVPILNQGVSGETTEDGLKRLPDILALTPRVVLVCLGGNDGLH